MITIHANLPFTDFVWNGKWDKQTQQILEKKKSPIGTFQPTRRWEENPVPTHPSKLPLPVVSSSSHIIIKRQQHRHNPPKDKRSDTTANNETIHSMKNTFRRWETSDSATDVPLIKHEHEQDPALSWVVGRLPGLMFVPRKPFMHSHLSTLF